MSRVTLNHKGELKDRQKSALGENHTDNRHQVARGKVLLNFAEENRLENLRQSNDILFGGREAVTFFCTE